MLDTVIIWLLQQPQQRFFMKMPLLRFKPLILTSTLLAGFWLAACKTTPAPSAPAPPQPESREIKDTRQSAPSPQPESADPGATHKSKTDPASSPEATAPQKPESQEKSQDRQSPPVSGAETRTPETEPRLPQSRDASRQTADAKLAKARDDLRVSQATERRIAAELEALKKSGDASDEEIRNYEAYLERVQAMVAENRKTVKKMESAYAQHPPGEKAPNQTAADDLDQRSDQKIPEEQTRDPVAELDRQLSASLSEFDAMLLKKMETIESESAAKMRDLAQEAAEAARRLKEKGVDLGTDESGSSDGASEKDGERPQGEAGEKEASREEKGSQTQQGDDKVATTGSPEGEGPGPKQDGGSRYSKEDDDIVARQLREAAEKETDPELKEKLWKEYEEYRKNTQQ